MISVSQVYDTVLSLIRKDKRGLSFSPDDYNAILHQVNQRVWRINYHGFEASKLSMDELGSLKIVDLPINLNGSGVGVLPPDYFHLVGDPWYIHPTEGRRKIDLVTSLEHGNREMDFLTKATALYPTCFMGYSSAGSDMAIYVTPTTCTPIYFSYLRQTTDPFLDYYVNDTTLDITYMAEGATVIVPLGCTSRSGVAGASNVVSLTKDYEWHPHDEPQILAQILQSIGMSLPDELLVQVGSANEIKVEKD
jgi:hypothetical protein